MPAKPSPEPSRGAARAGARQFRVRWRDVVTSTQEEVLAAARAGEAEGLVVAADSQTDGRGRRGRRWDAPARSSLLASVLLAPDRPDRMPVAAGLAARDACEALAGVRLGLKWPNDLVAAGGTKVGGVLADVVQTSAGPLVAVGVGLNVAWPDTLPPGVTDLRRCSGAVVDRHRLLDRLVEALDRRASQDPATSAEDYRAACVTVGREVRVDLGGGRSLEGRALDVTDEGWLVVRDDAGGSHAVRAGDVVHLRDRGRGPAAR